MVGYEAAYKVNSSFKREAHHAIFAELTQGTLETYGYLSAKRRKTVTHDDLMEAYNKDGTRSILVGLENYVQKNFCGE